MTTMIGSPDTDSLSTTNSQADGSSRGRANLLVLDEPVIVLTAARSGSTLLRRLLDAHPDLACPPETNLLRLCESFGALWAVTDPQSSDGDLSDAASESIRCSVEAVFGAYLRRRRKRRWCEKSLGSVQAIEPFLSLYPKAKFICLYRHCMDMIDSGLEATPWGLAGYGFDEFGVRFPGNSIVALAGYWSELTSGQLDFEEEHPDRCHRLYYEELVSDPERICQEMFSFIGVRHVAGLADRCLAAESDQAAPGDHKIMATSRISRDSVGRGTRIPASRLPPGQLQMINSLLARLGYAVVDDEWANCVLPPVVLPRCPASRGTSGQARRAVMMDLEELDEVIRTRAGGRLGIQVTDGLMRAVGPGMRAGIVAYHGDGTDAARYWEFDFGRAEVRTGDYAGCEELTADWLLTGHASTWRAVLAGAVNLATCIRARDLRYITFAAADQEEDSIQQRLASDRIKAMSHLLDESGVPAPAEPGACTDALASVRP
jgi:Sulfotransferase family